MTKVLVVDDTPEMAKLMAVAVKNQGYEVFVAGDGLHALQIAADEKPDALLLDIMMPGMGGIEVLRRLKTNTELCEIPVILVSAKNDDRDVVEGLQAGAFDYVTKPFKIPILTARLSSAIRVKESHDNVRQINEQLQAEIVKRKRKESELVQAQKLEAIGQLAAGIAHEINTPSQYIGDNIRFLQDSFCDINNVLSAFNELLEIAKKHNVNDELIQQVEKVVHQADLDYLIAETPKAIQQSLDGVDKVSKIIHAMKEFSHPGGCEKQVVDLNKMIENTLIVSRNEWKYVANLVTDFDTDMPMVFCYQNELNQVILNLVVNAAQAISSRYGKDSTNKGTITVATCHDENWAEIRIQDTGMGIAEDIRSKVFDYFFTTKEVGKGTGQGLTIANAIVTEKHGGTITFETKVGQGTTFIVRLPIAEDSTTVTNETESKDADVSGKNEKQRTEAGILGSIAER